MARSWFPGHMAKAIRELMPLLKLIDIVIELVDARAPASSSNPLLSKLISNKPVVVLLNKADLADPGVTQRWIDRFRHEGRAAVASDVLRGIGLDSALQRISAMRPAVRIKPRVLVIGMPNVGKSSLINRFAKRSKAKTGDKPGITKGKQWIDIAGADLLDTPGLMPLSVDDENSWNKLSALGIINDDLFNHEEVAKHIVNYVKIEYPGLLASRYEVSEDLSADILLENIASKRGFLMRGGAPDLDKAYMHVIRDLRSGRIGRISLEAPDEK